MNAETFLCVLQLRDDFPVELLCLHLRWSLDGMHGHEGSGVAIS